MRATIICLILGLLAACAAPAPAPFTGETRTIDGSYIFATGGARSGARLAFAGTIEPQEGKVFACVAIGHNAAPAAAQAAAEMRVALRFYAGEEKIDKALRHMATHKDTLSLIGKQANCALLDIPWKPEYADASVSLRFRGFRL